MTKAEAELPGIQKSQQHVCSHAACPHTEGGEFDSTSPQGRDRVLEERETGGVGGILGKYDLSQTTMEQIEKFK